MNKISKSETDKLKLYASNLDNLAKHMSTDVFSNKDHQHAAIAISKILKYSKKSFVLFDDDLKGDIVNNNAIVSFQESLVEFISRGGNVKVVISDRDDKVDNAQLRFFLEVLVDIFPNQMELKIASKAFKESMKKIFSEKINFAIGDNNKYRLEKFGESTSEEKTREASVSFNSEKYVSKILTIFKSNYNSCYNYF